jgi:RNA polymerase sigma-70 factor, ECF subfamily
VLLAEYGQVDDRTYDSDDEGKDQPLAGDDPTGAAGPEPPGREAAGPRSGSDAAGSHAGSDGAGSQAGGDAAGPQPGGGDPAAAARAARMENELDALALRASHGDQRALGELLDRIRGPVVWQCRARMNGRTIGQQTPEDIAQEVLIAVCGALSRFRPAETRWMAFVYGIVRNKVIDAFRAAGRDRSEPMEELPDHVDDDRAGPEAAVLRSADRDLLHELLAELPDAQREVLVARVAMGYSAEETARMVGSTPGAVRVTQHRAMVKLRALLAHRMVDRE